MILLLIVSVVESSQLHKLFSLIYEKEISIIISIFVVSIYTIVSLKSNKRTKVTLSIAVFGLLFLSYTNTIKEKYMQALNEKKEKINLLEKEISSLSSKLTSTNKSKCSQESKNYSLCAYLVSIETKNESKIKTEIKERIVELKTKKEIVEKERLNLTDFYFSICVAVLSSLFLSISILEISNRLKDKEEKAIVELLERGYSIEQISKKLNLSRATIYRRLKNERN